MSAAVVGQVELVFVTGYEMRVVESVVTGMRVRVWVMGGATGRAAGLGWDADGNVVGSAGALEHVGEDCFALVQVLTDCDDLMRMNAFLQIDSSESGRDHGSPWYCPASHSGAGARK